MNSYHNNVIAQPASGLMPLAVAEDETVEAFVFPGRQVIGVLWHPEREERPREHDVALFRKHFMKGES